MDKYRVGHCWLMALVQL